MILDTNFPPDPRVENEALALISAGHEVHLFCFSFSKDFKSMEISNGIHIHRHYCNKVVYKLSALAYTLPFYHLLLSSPIQKFILKTNVDVIHIHDLQIARAVFNIKSNKIIVLDLHENRPEIMKHYAHVNSFLGKFLINPDRWKKFEFKYISHSDKVIIVTEAARDYYCEKIGIDNSKFIVLPNTVRKEFYKEYKIDDSILERYNNSFNVLYFGDTGIRRGTLELIEAAALIRKEIPHLKIILVGKSKEDKLLSATVKKLNLETTVDMVGWQDFKLFPSYLKAAHIGVSPLHKNIHHDTTYANKLFQYMAFGLPLVVSDSTAQRNLVESVHCGLVHKDKSVKEIANQLLKLYQDQDLYQSCSENSRTAIEEKYNWEVTSLELISFYNSL